MADRVRIPKQYSAFIADVRKRAKKHGVKFLLNKHQNFVECGGINSNGYFSDEDPPTLAVGMGSRPLHQWFIILLHESCHMDQWIEQTDVWNNCTVGNGEWDTTAVIDLWINNIVELNIAQRNDYIKRSFEVELDCEKRSAAAIEKWDLPIHVPQYIQKANAYVTFYKIIQKSRKWYKIGKEPYYIRKIWKQMPTKFVEWETPVPKRIRDLYEETLRK